eukprot:scaffold81122_cov26-Tisochrysis_lutea.AAC.5
MDVRDCRESSAVSAVHAFMQLRPHAATRTCFGAAEGALSFAFFLEDFFFFLAPAALPTTADTPASEKGVSAAACWGVGCPGVQAAGTFP